MGKPILLIIGLALGLGLFVYFFSILRKFIKNRSIGETERKIEKSLNLKLLSLTISLGVSSVFFALGICLTNSWTLSAGYKFLVIFGSFIVGFAFATFFASFYLRFYCLDLDKKQVSVCRKIIPISFITLLLGLWIFSEGIATQDIYPLISGINIKKGFITPNDYTEGLTIKFYGLVIVGGALICYFITDHETYKKFGKHGLIDTLFVFAFLCGLFGARLWYCLVLEGEYFLANPKEIITGMTNGGLAIQGGAILGMAGGITFVLIFRKYIDVRFLMDVAIPTILIAQAIGRWGNFFNQEVYGGVAPTWLTNLLPTIIKKNMYIYSSVDLTAAYRVPLFLIESLINIGGYFIIRYLFGKVFKFNFGLGYQAALYMIWYGLVRFILEPLREGFTLSVGSSEAFGYMQSWIIAIGMMIAGAIWLAAMVILHKVRMAKGLEDKFGEKIKAQ